MEIPCAVFSSTLVLGAFAWRVESGKCKSAPIGCCSVLRDRLENGDRSVVSALCIAVLRQHNHLDYAIMIIHNDT